MRIQKGPIKFGATTMQAINEHHSGHSGRLEAKIAKTKKVIAFYHSKRGTVSNQWLDSMIKHYEKVLKRLEQIRKES